MTYLLLSMRAVVEIEMVDAQVTLKRDLDVPFDPNQELIDITQNATRKQGAT